MRHKIRSSRRGPSELLCAAALSREVKSSVRTKSFQQAPHHALLSAFCRFSQRKILASDVPKLYQTRIAPFTLRLIAAVVFQTRRWHDERRCSVKNSHSCTLNSAQALYCGSVFARRYAVG
jgi:hypothetical protein